MDYEKLRQSLAKASIKAMEFKDCDDGGTSNFDTPVISLVGTSEGTLKGYFDLEYGVYKTYHQNYCIGYRILEGQGNRRTKMAQAFAESLRDDGYVAYVKYVMD